jgi:phage-related baseplate assembly protein
VRLTNAAAGVYVLAIGDVTFSNSATGATYRNTDGGTLLAADTLDLSVEAETAGAAGTAGVGEIDTLVSPTMIGVTVANTTTGVGTDEESDAALRQRCRDSLAALSPDGAAAAYAYVATSALRVDDTPIGITRTRVSATDGAVTVILADADGAPEAGDVTRIDDLIQTQVVPLGVTCTVSGASGLTVPVTYTAFVSTGTHASDVEIKAAVATALETYFATIPIAGWPTAVPGVGAIYTSDIISVVDSAQADIFRVTLAAPAADIAPTSAQVAILGTVTGTVTRWDP